MGKEEADEAPWRSLTPIAPCSRRTTPMHGIMRAAHRFASSAARIRPERVTSMTVNGEPIRYRLDPETPLLWALRDASNLTGAKYGCDSRDCGACTVLIDGRATLSCTVSIGSLEGADVVTIEGLGSGGSHPLQAAWADAQVTQCGACDPGFIMALAALLRTNPRPSPADLEALPNLCRCGAMSRVFKAVAAAGMAARQVAPQAPATPASGTAETPVPAVQPPLR